MTLEELKAEILAGLIRSAKQFKLVERGFAEVGPGEKAIRLTVKGVEMVEGIAGGLYKGPKKPNDHRLN